MDSNQSSLIRCLRNAVRRGDPTQVRVEGGGSVSVYPREYCYVTDIRDWERVFGTDALGVAPALWDTAPEGAHSLDDLLWRAHFYNAKAQAAAGPCALCHPVQLLSTPDLERLPAELVEPFRRVCEALASGPAPGCQVAEMAALPPDVATAVLKVLRDRGHARIEEEADSPAS